LKGNGEEKWPIPTSASSPFVGKMEEKAGSFSESFSSEIKLAKGFHNPGRTRTELANGNGSSWFMFIT
jgi:hypothetical protein